MSLVIKINNRGPKLDPWELQMLTYQRMISHHIVISFSKNISRSTHFVCSSAMEIAYSPKTSETEEIMSFIGRIVGNVVGLNNSKELEQHFVSNVTNGTKTFGFQFPDDYSSRSIRNNLTDLSISIRSV